MRKLKNFVIAVVLFLYLGVGGSVLAVESYTPGEDFNYGCSVQGCDGYNVVVADDTDVCGSGWKIVCGYNMSGEYEGDGDFRGSCSCAKLADDEESTPSGFCGNCYEADDGTFKARTDSCKDGFEPQCHDGYGDPGTRECICTVAGIVEENATGNTSYEMRVTTHVYNPLCDGDTGIETAFGCISFSASGFATKFLQLLFGIAGGIAFLLMVYGFILVATSSGDEKKLQAARETVSSAMVGLLVSLFALFLFRLITINILKLPGINSDGTIESVDTTSSSTHINTTTNSDGTTTETEHGGGGRSF